jgi:5-formyltetrahydrofolate cyclo-ligase
VSSVEAKRALRRAMRVKWAHLAPEACVAAGRVLADRLARVFAPPTEGLLLLGSASTGGEMDAWTAQEAWLAAGGRLALPRVVGEGALEWHLVASRAQLIPGFRNIPEPDPATAPRVDPATAHLVFVPGIAFDRQGGRLGRGGGYYDRLLATLPREVIRIGIAHEFQLVDAVPREPHDARVDWVATDAAVRRCG